MPNTSEIGEVTKAQVLAALVCKGEQVLIPFGDHLRYDLALDREDGRLWRIQCKTGRLIKGALYFPTSSVVARSRSGQKTVRTPYRGQIEFFGVYCPDNGKVYLVPAERLPPASAWLRVDPPRNNQRWRIHWAKDYEIGAVAQLGARQNGILEGTGSIPVGSTSPQAGLWD